MLLSISGIYNDIYVQHDMTLNLIISNSHWKFSHLDTLWTSRWILQDPFLVINYKTHFDIVSPKHKTHFHLSHTFFQVKVLHFTWFFTYNVGRWCKSQWGWCQWCGVGSHLSTEQLRLHSSPSTIYYPLHTPPYFHHIWYHTIYIYIYINAYNYFAEYFAGSQMRYYDYD